MPDNMMVLDEWWPDYHSTNEDDPAYLEYLDAEYEQANNY